MMMGVNLFELPFFSVYLAVSGWLPVVSIGPEL